jgi:hypothetical protein
MKKLISCALLALGVFCLTTRSEAASAARGAKEIKAVGYQTNVSSITTLSVLQSTSGVLMPGVVYQVTTSTGASGDFCLMYDSNTGVGFAALGVATGSSNVASQLGPRLILGSTSASTVYTFDPPIIFYNGLMTQCSSAADGLAVTYEIGRNLGGQ